MNYTFEGPGHYRIIVKGQLDAGESDRFGGMGITTEKDTETQGFISILTGQLMDQAQLMGILNTLYGVHLPILGIETLAEGDCCNEAE